MTGAEPIRVRLKAPVATSDEVRADASLEASAEAWFPSPASLVELAMVTADAGRPEGLTGILGRLGVPLLDLIVTPYTARAALLGARVGRAFYHHELRQRVPMPPGLEPEINVWGAGTVPEWRAGVLEEPKYFSFFQDAPLVSYNPNHRRKWRAHELLHGAQGFFWSPHMTRFELYLGARLNELLPVVHWYGLDEILRPRSAAWLDRDRRLATPAQLSPACEALAAPYWTFDAGWRERMQPVALDAARHAHAHFIGEWDDCLAELAGGQRRRTVRGHLDASSDSVGYLRGHWNRTTAWSFGSWVETFLVDGVDYHSTLRGYFEHCASVALDLVAGDLNVSLGTFERHRGRRMLQDVGYRMMVALEWLDEGGPSAQTAERALMPVLESAGRLCQGLLEDASRIDEVPACVHELFEALDTVRHVLPQDMVATIKALGYTWPDVERASGRPRAFWALAARKLLADGVQSCCPETWTALEGTGQETLMRFAGSPDIFDRAEHLATRLADWLEDPPSDGPPVAPLLAERARFEAWASALPRVDEEAELFGTVPEEPHDLSRRRGRLRAQQTLRRHTFSDTIVSELIGEPAHGRELAGVVRDGELRLMMLDDAGTLVLDRLAAADGELPTTEIVSWLDNGCGEALVSLIEHGFVVWLPAP